MCNLFDFLVATWHLTAVTCSVCTKIEDDEEKEYDKCDQQCQQNLAQSDPLEAC